MHTPHAPPRAPPPLQAFRESLSDTLGVPLGAVRIARATDSADGIGLRLSFTVAHLTSARRAKAVAALLGAPPFPRFLISQLRHDGLPMLGQERAGPAGQLLLARPRVLVALGGGLASSSSSSAAAAAAAAAAGGSHGGGGGGGGDGDDDDGPSQRRRARNGAAATAAAGSNAQNAAAAAATGGGSSSSSSTHGVLVSVVLVGGFVATLGLVALPLLRQQGGGGEGSSAAGGKEGRSGGAAVAPLFGATDVGPPVVDYGSEEVRSLLQGAAEPEAAQQHERFVGVAIGAGGSGAGGAAGERALYYPAGQQQHRGASAARSTGIVGDDEDAI